MKAMARRLRRLETRHNPDDWQQWEGRPVRDWPDAALDSRIRHCLGGLGLPPDTEVREELLESVANGEPNWS
jgi:hypothetical protein